MNELAYSKIILNLEEARSKIANLNQNKTNDKIRQQTNKVLNELEKLSNLVTSHFVQVQHNDHH